MSPAGTRLAGDASAAVDRGLRDPQDVVAPAGDSVPPPIKGHWPCESDEHFTDAARELVDRLRDLGRG